MFTIRPLDPTSDSEVRSIVAFSLMTVWETTPELRVDLRTVPGFSFEEIEKHTRQSARDPNHRYLVALDQDGALCGHTIFYLTHDADDVRYGYCFTRYVLPIHRRHGLASRFLTQALDWFGEHGARHAIANSHVNNLPLRNLFERFGFKVVDRLEGRWPTLVLRRELEARKVRT